MLPTYQPALYRHALSVRPRADGAERQPLRSAGYRAPGPESPTQLRPRPETKDSYLPPFVGSTVDAVTRRAYATVDYFVPTK